MSSEVTHSAGESLALSPDSHTAEGGGPPDSWDFWSALKRLFSPRNMGVVYVWIAIIVVFSFWAPDTFPTWTTVKTILNQEAIAGLVALALVVPLSAGVFDLSIGSAMGLTNVLVAWLLVDKGVAIAPAILASLAAGLVIGLINGFVVVGVRIDSFIATLATASLMDALDSLLTNNQSITGNQLYGTFGKIATTNVGGIALPVFLMLIVAAALWFVQGYTVIGRRIYAVGFNALGARLAGIRIARLRFLALIVSGFVAGVAGVLLASQVSSGSYGIGPPYLLNAFAAAFLGSTQFGGRFNAWGTVVAVLLLGTGTTGLVLVGAQPWAQSMFSGIVLLSALAVSNVEASAQARAWIKSRRRSAPEAASQTVGRQT
jgi:ribose transport system permease protein